MEALSILLSMIAIGISGYIFFKKRKTQIFGGTHNFNIGWQMFNQVVVNDQSFIDFEREIHPFGELSHQEMKRVYFYFMRFNVVHSAYLGSQELHKNLGKSSLNNEANLSFPDRAFIRKNVFGRGYDKEFATEFEKRWDTIKKDGKYLPMHGVGSDKYLSHMTPLMEPRQLVLEDRVRS